MNTTNFYNSKSALLIKRYDDADMTVLHNLLLEYLKPKCSVLDIGFGSGRDLQFLKDNNYNIWGIDSSKNFIKNAQIRFSNISNHFIHSSIPFPKDKPIFPIKFDAVISIAMWMHLKKEQYKNVITNIVSMVKDKSTIVISYSKGKRDNDERYFEDIDLEYITQLFHYHDFKLIKTVSNTDSLNRDNLTWITVIYRHD